MNYKDRETISQGNGSGMREDTEYRKNRKDFGRGELKHAE